MENASKALIIAGAILLAILIIGLGVFIYNQAANTVGDTGLDQLAVRQVNGQFEPYLNTEMGASYAKSLIDTINLNNSTSTNYVEYVGPSKNQIKLGHKYVIRTNLNNSSNSKLTSSSNNNGGVINYIELIDVTEGQKTDKVMLEKKVVTEKSVLEAK